MGTTLGTHCWKGNDESYEWTVPKMKTRIKVQGKISRQQSHESDTTSSSESIDEDNEEAKAQIFNCNEQYSQPLVPFDVYELLPKIYRIDNIIAKGTTATCYRCLRLTDHKVFACKVINKHQITLEPDRRATITQQLRVETEVLEHLDHPNIVKLEASFENDDYLIILLEYLDGGELFDVIIERGRLNETEARNVIRSILSALEHMHKQGVIHRDIKPENVLLSTNANGSYNIKLIDFGFSKIIKWEGTTNSFLGTGGYLAPEILQHLPYNTTADMWSCGVVLYLILCGRLPFTTNTELHSQTNCQPTFPDEYWVGVSDSAQDLVQRLLLQNSQHRISATQALQHAWLKAT